MWRAIGNDADVFEADARQVQPLRNAMCPGFGVRNPQPDATAAHGLADLINSATAKQPLSTPCDVACQRDRHPTPTAAPVVISYGRFAVGFDLQWYDLVGIGV